MSKTYLWVAESWYSDALPYYPAHDYETAYLGLQFPLSTGTAVPTATALSGRFPQLGRNPFNGRNGHGHLRSLKPGQSAKSGESHPNALIIGSDQVALLDGRLVGKPGTHEVAQQQLRQASGREMSFHTALCLLNASTGVAQQTRVDAQVRYRTLTDDEIERYLRADTPYDCAGSGRIETLGIALVDYVRSDDPTALIGLPLIALAHMLRQEGVALP